MADGLVKQLDYDHRDKANPPAKPSRYDYHFLELARQMEANGGARVLNPRDVSARSLFMADADWLGDLALYNAWVNAAYDRKRPAPRA